MQSNDNLLLLFSGSPAWKSARRFRFNGSLPVLTQTKRRTKKGRLALLVAAIKW